MKKRLTLSVFTILFFLGGISLVNAAVLHKADKSNALTERIEREIRRNIFCPQFLAEKTGTNVVRALIEIDGKGKITVDEINSSDDRLRDYVVAQLKDMTVKNITNPEKFVLLVRFVVG